MIIINEYILTIKSSVAEGFRVYAPNKKVAINTFMNACRLYNNTRNKCYEDYWNDMLNYMDSGDYTIIKNEDFIGLRKLI